MAHVEGFAYGFAQSIMYFAFAAAYTYGAHLVIVDDMEFHNIFK